MRKTSAALPKTIAVIRMATSAFFLLFGQYKVFGPEFTHGGFQENIQGFIQNGAVSFYRPVLVNLVLPHAVFFGYLVGVVELFIGVCLLLGPKTAAGPRPRHGRLEESPPKPESQA